MTAADLRESIKQAAEVVEIDLDRDVSMSALGTMQRRIIVVLADRTSPHRSSHPPPSIHALYRRLIFATGDDEGQRGAPGA